MNDIDTCTKYHELALVDNSTGKYTWNLVTTLGQESSSLEQRSNLSESDLSVTVKIVKVWHTYRNRRLWVPAMLKAGF